MAADPGSHLLDFTYLLFFNCYFPNTIFFPLYSMVTQLRKDVYIIFSPIVMLCCKYLEIVLRDTPQDITVNLFKKKYVE